MYLGSGVAALACHLSSLEAEARLLPGFMASLGYIGRPGLKKEQQSSQAVVAHTFNPSTQEAETSASL